MRSKIQYSFTELPPSSHTSLRSSLSPTTSQVIITQFCLAMADLILLMPEWSTALSELMAALSISHTIPLLEVLLLLPEVLLLLPEEVDSRHLRLGANRRERVKEMLAASSPHNTDTVPCLSAGHGAGPAEGDHCEVLQLLDDPGGYLPGHSAGQPRDGVCCGGALLPHLPTYPARGCQ